jgi:hypothetical protein
MSGRVRATRSSVSAARPLVLVGLMLFVGASLRAQDAPHWGSVSLNIDCTSQCHVGHSAQGGTLSQAAGDVNLCQSCHNPVGLGGDLPVATAEKAVPGESGTSHAFGVDWNNPAAGAGFPADLEMQRRLPNDQVVCSTCHDPHKAEQTQGGTPRVGNAVKVRLGDPTPGTGVLAASGVYSGPEGVWYLIEIVAAGGANSAEFCYSKDNGISWRPTGCDPPNTVFTPSQTASDFGVALDDGFGVSLVFGAGTYELGERWEVSAAYPFLRVALGVGGSNLCLECHGAWNVSDAGTWTGNALSHPIGVPIPAGDFHSPPLDGDGTGDDSIASNDLQLFSSNVQCLTCHGIHFVDSNTQTEDGP